MHIFFSGIGGTGIGPLALIAKQAGFDVSGSDKQSSQYTDYLKQHGIDLYVGQTRESLEELKNKKPIDWYVYSSALPLENPNHPELIYINELGIKHSKRDEFLSYLINEKELKLIAFAGTHGNTTSTAMAVWVAKQLGLPVSYSVGAKISYGDMGVYDSQSEYFLYECDEFDNNFLAFNPYIAALTKVDWDHHEIFPTRDSYIGSFKQFCGQSDYVIAHGREIDYLGLKGGGVKMVDDALLIKIKLPGAHNRENAATVAAVFKEITNKDETEIIEAVNSFPGSNRRFEKLANNIYSDYAHTPEEIAATLQLAKELSNNLVVVYEPLTNRRQHFMKDMYKDVFKDLKALYWVPSYLAREDPNLEIIQPSDFVAKLDASANAEASFVDDSLKTKLLEHSSNGDLVLLLAGGGGKSLDEWARANLVA